MLRREIGRGVGGMGFIFRASKDEIRISFCMAQHKDMLANNLINLGWNT